MWMRDSTRTVTAKPAEVAMPSRLSAPSCCSFMMMVDNTVKISMNVPRNSAIICNAMATLSGQHLISTKLNDKFQTVKLNWKVL